MSVELEIIPCEVAELDVDRVQSCFNAYSEGKFSKLNFISMKDNKALTEAHFFEIDNSYKVSTDGVNSLYLSLNINDKVTSEYEILSESTSSELSDEDIKRISDAWTKIGYSYKVISSSGRGENDLIV